MSSDRHIIQSITEQFNLSSYNSCSDNLDNISLLHHFLLFLLKQQQQQQKQRPTHYEYQEESFMNQDYHNEHLKVENSKRNSSTFSIDSLLNDPSSSIKSDISNQIVRNNNNNDFGISQLISHTSKIREYPRHQHHNVEMRQKENSKLLFKPLKVFSCNSLPNKQNSSNANQINHKRSRFTFKTEHLLIMNKKYQYNPYPDSRQRIQIAYECNLRYGQSTNRNVNQLKKNEIVTKQIVTHWFQNKRKLVKRIKRQEPNTIQ
ncbi:hypothetical protein SNEBB_005190 [Seison nebaliae]|nr:hypothetical protein SNEBB_005190 [Seison nebaliae]